jgi:hypothetical protein
MPRYYFDIQKGMTVTPDPDGLELDDLGAAECEAVRTVAEIGRHLLPASEARDVAIAVRNEHGEPVMTVTLSLTIERTAPARRASVAEATL